MRRSKILQNLAADPGVICRICHMEGSDVSSLYQPCLCMGSIGNVHQDCLKQWINVSKHDVCELCQYKYKFRKPCSRLQIYWLFAKILGQTFFNYCLTLYYLAAQLSICLYLLPMFIADFTLLIFKQRGSIYESRYPFFHQLCTGYEICVAILLLSFLLNKLRIMLQSCPKLCWADEYKLGRGSSASTLPLRHSDFYSKGYAGWEICHYMLTCPEKGLTGLVSFFIRIASFFLTCILAYIFLPYLLARNILKLHSYAVENILQGYAFTALLICLIYKLRRLFNCKQIRFHSYICCAYAKVVLFLCWQHLLLPLCCGCAINCTALLLRKQCQLCYDFAENPLQCVKFYLTGFLFNACLQEYLHVLSANLEKSCNYLQLHSVLLLARTACCQQLKKELQRVSLLTAGIVLCVWIPAYILYTADNRQHEALQMLYAFVWIRAVFKFLQRKSATASCLLSFYRLIELPSLHWWLSRLWAVFCCGAFIVGVSLLQLRIIFELGWLCASENLAYTYVYGTFMFYFIKLLYERREFFRWQKLRGFNAIFPIVIIIPGVLYQGFLFVQHVLMPCAMVVSHYLPITLIGIGVLLLVLNDSYKGLVSRHLQDLWQGKFQCLYYELLLRYLVATFIYPAHYTLERIFKLSFGTTLFLFAGTLLVRREVRSIYLILKELLQTFENEKQLQNYPRKERVKRLFNFLALK